MPAVCVHVHVYIYIYTCRHIQHLVYCRSTCTCRSNAIYMIVFMCAVNTYGKVITSGSRGRGLGRGPTIFLCPNARGSRLALF